MLSFESSGARTFRFIAKRQLVEAHRAFAAIQTEVVTQADLAIIAIVAVLAYAAIHGLLKASIVQTNFILRQLLSIRFDILLHCVHLRLRNFALLRVQIGDEVASDDDVGRIEGQLEENL